MKSSILYRVAVPTMAIFVATMVSSHAQTTLISSTVRNGSFELPALGASGDKVNFGTADPTDWGNTGSTYSDSGVQYTTAYASDGNQYAYLLNNDDGIYNLTSYSMLAGDQFVLTWDAKSTNPSFSELQTVTLFGSTDGTYGTAYTLNQLADGNMPASSQSGAYQSYTLTYTATAADAGNTIGVSFDNTTAGPNNYWGSWDNVKLQLVPEPSAYAMVLAALAMLFGVRRFRRPSA